MRRNRSGTYARRQSDKVLQKRKKAAAVKIKKAQVLLRQAHNLVKNIIVCEELDLAKYAIIYSHSQMSSVTELLDGTGKDALVPVMLPETDPDEGYEVYDVEASVPLPGGTL